MPHFRVISNGFALLLTLVLTTTPSPHALAKADGIAWQPYTDAVFEQAAREGKVVLLNLEAVWCHWCHVMAEQTYAQPQVQALIAEHFLPVKVDQDARPDLSTRYRDWGWPATIFINSQGQDIAKRAGFIGPEPFARLLRAIVKDPTPEARAAPPRIESFATGALLASDLRVRLQEKHARNVDAELGGLRTAQKFLDRDALEWSLVRASQSDAGEANLARVHLDGARNLLDPAWGGVYQYSTGGDWQHPHYEKLTHIQAGYLRSYALAYGTWRNDRDLDAARAIVRYVDGFLTSPEGAFYVSQDADLVPGEHSAEYFALGDAARRRAGIPRIDQHRYARENGLLIEALATLYEYTGEPELLLRAARAMQWVAATRQLPNGAYQHDERDLNGGYLADNLAMARALLQMYRVTADRRFLSGARRVADYMTAHFHGEGAGVLPVADSGGPLAPLPDLDDNIAYARFNNLLFHYTGDARFRQAAEHAMRFLATPQVAARRLVDSGILIADQELANDPLHLTIVAGKDAAGAAALVQRALQTRGAYKRVEWWDKREGDLPNPDVTYPDMGKPAAFVCTNKVCSVPLFSPEAIAEFLDKRLGDTAQPTR